MSKTEKPRSWNHKAFANTDGTFQILWSQMIERRNVSTFTARHRRNTDLAGAKRFAAKWGIEVIGL